MTQQLSDASTSLAQTESHQCCGGMGPGMNTCSGSGGTENNFCGSACQHKDRKENDCNKVETESDLLEQEIHKCLDCKKGSEAKVSDASAASASKSDTMSTPGMQKSMSHIKEVSEYLKKQESDL
mmetsp:Transcript_32304/g.38018  ORF Transcript_32304/g.38018 Transcript_32304/m.38018 type:complete len:125 (-) Transcript_32304:2649-3023(-)